MLTICRARSGREPAIEKLNTIIQTNKSHLMRHKSIVLSVTMNADICRAHGVCKGIIDTL